jgi:hypothetical protein
MKLNSPLRLVLVLAMIAGAVAGALKLKEWIVIDQCLDLGGRWNDALGECEHGR